MQTANIKMDDVRTIDSDNIEYIITITNDNGELLVEDYARLIVSSNSFHLNDSLEESCEFIGIEPSDLQMALENRSNVVKMVEKELPQNHLSKADLSKTNKNSKVQIVIDVEYEPQTLIDENETAESMARYVENVVQSEIGNGLLTGRNYKVEVGSYSIGLKTL